MEKIIGTLLFFLLMTSPALADSLRVGCVKLERICSRQSRCVWWGPPGEALYVDLVKKSSTDDSELFEGQLEASLDGRKFTLGVLQKRMVGKSPINYIKVDLPVSADVVVSSEGLVYSHVKYINKNQGINIRCSTGI